MLVCILLLAIVNNEKISRQMAQLREARQRNELLLQINATNNDFLRTVAHELKTPLTVISGYAQLIERQMKRDQLSEKTPERLETIHSEADRLAEMVSQLMDYTYGKAKTAEMTAVKIDDLFRSASAIMTPVCEKKQNVLTFQNDSASHIHGNAELLLQVLINLIVNASRHTDGGQITVAAKDNGDQVEITVTDTGSGIAPEAEPHIFEKGYSTDDGRGLGLAICADTVRLHGGELSLASTSPEGSVFRFIVPEGGKIMSNCILLVEDNPHIMEINAEALVMEDYAVLKADTGRGCLEMLKTHDVDLIVLDIMLPDADGLALCRQIKAQYDIPILFLSALGENQQIIEGLRAGGDDYLPKPYDIGVLLARVEARLRAAGGKSASFPMPGCGWTR